MPTEAHTTMPPGAAAATHRHPHPHPHQYSTASLLGASVVTRLAIVAGVVAVLWVAIAWALA
jgi:hypothetical protein